MSKIEMRTILKDDNNTDYGMIQNLTFVIKEYQRGYRWESEQIEALLEDIKEFKTKDGVLKYCLQPLVVKKIEGFNQIKNKLSTKLKRNSFCECNSEGVWELIDGQQRLTTILLILNECYSNPKELPFDLIYVNTRKIDEYYMEKAQETIDKWFESFGAKADDIKADIRIKIHSNIQFIWYEVQNNANSSEVFTKLNMGKIPLTNAELFKALLLKNDVSNNNGEKQKDNISFEWDAIEQSLYGEDFWYFIANENKDSETRIDYLLKMFAETNIKTNNLIVNKDDKLYPFIVVDKLIKNKKTSVEKVWEEIVKIHDLLQEWYFNIDLYHKIGFVIAVSPNPDKIITSLIVEMDGKKKSEIGLSIDKKLENEFKNIDLESLDYKNSYDKVNIKKVLLFFNIYTMINSKTQSRFSFKQYKDVKVKWDIEHINARATDEELENIKDSVKIELLNEVKKQLQYVDDKDAVKKIQDFIDTKIKDSSSADFVKFYHEINNKYGNFNENGLGNLTLLDAEINRSYKNALFAVKRKKIIEKDKGEVFIPVCTKNVFLKMYSNNKGLQNMLQWNVDDAEAYLNEIKKALYEGAKLLCQTDKK